MQSTTRWIGAGVLALGLSGIWASPALADEHDTAATPTPAPEIVHTGASPDSPSAAAQTYPEPTADRYPKLDVPNPPWAYDTHYFFAVTRGLGDEVQNDVGRYCAMAGTVVVDVVTLPGAALAGLFGT